jgi:hypothetical protein
MRVPTRDAHAPVIDLQSAANSDKNYECYPTTLNHDRLNNFNTHPLLRYPISERPRHR